MSILQKLTEGVQSRDMRAEGTALLNKWEATGLLEGLGNESRKQGMAVLLENQAKELLREASSMAAGDVEGFAAVAFPIVRRVFGGLIANDLISVQPMSLPSGLIFFMDFTHSNDKAGLGAGSSLYGGGIVGKELVDGVKEIEQSGFYGLSTGYAAATGSAIMGNAAISLATRVANPSTSKDLDFDPDLDGEEVIVLTCSTSDANRVEASELLLADPRMSRAYVATQTGFAHGDVAGADDAAQFTDTNGDTILCAIDDNSATPFGVAAGDNDLIVVRLRQVRRLTAVNTETSSEGLKVPTAITRLVFKIVSITDCGQMAIPTSAAGAVLCETNKLAAGEVATFVGAVTLGSTHHAAVGAVLEANDFTISLPLRDDINSSGLGTVVAGAMPLEEPRVATGNTAADDRSGKNDIAEIDIKVDSVAVTAQTKKLKAKWTPELGQDLNAYHNLDAEVELTGILSEQIALEIDRELLGELVDGATAGTRYWSRAPGLFVNSSGTEIGASSAAPDFTGTVSEWYETLIETINDVSAQIHRKTLRGGANFVVCSPEVANILEFTSGFRASVTADQDRGTIGAVKSGSLSKKFDVYVDPYFLRNVILVGRKGSSFLESGFVYAPYVPLQVTPTIFGTEDFVPRKGVMTRYAKKMVRPDMYGLVIVRGLLGEAGATAA